MDYTTIPKGTKANFAWNDFDGKGTITGVVTETHIDHLIVRGEEMDLWCDDDNVDMFEFGIS